jgi:hypothetical protein
VATGGEGVGNGGVDSEEALGGTRGAETLHLALAPPDRHMRALSPVVLALASDMLGGQTELTGRRPVSAERRSVTKVAGAIPCFLRSFRINRSAARLSRLPCTSISRISPSASTARHKYI